MPMEGVRWLVEPLPAAGSGRRVAERAAAYGLLCRLAGCKPRLEHDPQGRPFLPDFPTWSVSISHCREAVAVAVAVAGKVGIDVECRRPLGEGLAERVCTAGELAAVRAAADPAMAFLRLWTRKEAVLKCRGTGIRGFSSLVHALEDSAVAVGDVPCAIPGVVVSLALM